MNLNDPNCIFKIKAFKDGLFSFGQVDKYSGFFSFGQVDKKSGLANGITRWHFKNGIYEG